MHCIFREIADALDVPASQFAKGTKRSLCVVGHGLVCFQSM